MSVRLTGVLWGSKESVSTLWFTAGIPPAVPKGADEIDTGRDILDDGLHLDSEDRGAASS